MWISTVQDPVNGDANDGGSMYTPTWSWVNILKTGNLLQQMSLVGDTAATPRVQDALDYMERHWSDNNHDPGWSGGAGVASYQATFTAMKGFISLGIHEFGDPAIDWQTDFETELLDEQNPDGSWPLALWDNGYMYGDPPILSTIWALLTLEKAGPPYPVPLDVKPESCRNPLNVNSRGGLPVAIAGTDVLDVMEIEISSLRLEGVYPLRWGHEDVATPFEPLVGKQDAFDCTEAGADGIMDLTMLFDAQEIVSAVGDVEDGDVIILHLTGSLLDGTAIYGEDVVVILRKGR
jgi:hypothetical protein